MASDSLHWRGQEEDQGKRRGGGRQRKQRTEKKSDEDDEEQQHQMLRRSLRSRLQSNIVSVNAQIMSLKHPVWLFGLFHRRD